MLPSSPSIADTWSRIEQVLQKHVPETARTLGRPASNQEIDDLQSVMGLVLPAEFRESLGIHNGQDDPTRLHHFFTEGLLASSTQIAETWQMQNEMDEEFRGQDANWDTHGHGEWWNRHWVPFTVGDGDCLCINLNPQVREGGTFGEIVCFVHDNPHEPGIAMGYGAWLRGLAQLLENGEFTIDEYGYLNLKIS